MPFYLDKAQYEKLKSAQTELHDLLPTIDDAEACGIECQALRGVVKAIWTYLRKWKSGSLLHRRNDFELVNVERRAKRPDTNGQPRGRTGGTSRTDRYKTINGTNKTG